MRCYTCGEIMKSYNDVSNEGMGDITWFRCPKCNSYAVEGRDVYGLVREINWERDHDWSKEDAEKEERDKKNYDMNQYKLYISIKDKLKEAKSQGFHSTIFNIGRMGNTSQIKMDGELYSVGGTLDSMELLSKIFSMLTEEGFNVSCTYNIGKDSYEYRVTEKEGDIYD